MSRLTDSELDTLMAPRLALLKAQTIAVRPREHESCHEHKEPNDIKGASTRATSNDQQTQSQQGEHILSIEQREYLQNIVEFPYLSTTQRAAKFGYSAYMHDKIKKQAIGAGYAEELAINLGHSTRGNVKFLELTPTGYSSLGLTTAPCRPQNCSAEHFWYQKAICDWYRKKGFEAHVEYCLKGKNADIGVLGRGRVIAIEVAMTPKNEVRNAIADLDAGFDEVRVLAKNTAVKAAVDEALSTALTPKQLSHVTTALLSDGAFLKDIFNS